MAATVQLSELRTRVREWVDRNQTATEVHADSVLNRLINTSRRRWHGLLARAVPERFSKTVNITANGSTSYSLPSDWLSTLLVQEQEDADTIIDLVRVGLHERSLYPQTSNGDDAYGYYIQNGSIYLTPPPTTGTYVHTYVYIPTDLSDDTDTVDGVNGWEEWLVLDVAAKLMAFEDSDASQLIALRNDFQKDMQAAARDQDYANPKRIARTRTRSRRTIRNNRPISDLT